MSMKNCDKIPATERSCYIQVKAVAERSKWYPDILMLESVCVCVLVRNTNIPRLLGLYASWVHKRYVKLTKDLVFPQPNTPGPKILLNQTVM